MPTYPKHEVRIRCQKFHLTYRKLGSFAFSHTYLIAVGRTCDGKSLEDAEFQSMLTSCLVSLLSLCSLNFLGGSERERCADEDRSPDCLLMVSRRTQTTLYLSLVRHIHSQHTLTSTTSDHFDKPETPAQDHLVGSCAGWRCHHRPILPRQCFECNPNRAERRYLVRLSRAAEMNL